MHISPLLKQILLENTHKQSMAQSTVAENMQPHKSLLEELEVQTQCCFAFSHRFFMNIPTNWVNFSRMTQAKWGELNIHTIRDKDRQTFQKVKNIAQQFLSYYQSLYNLHTEEKPDSHCASHCDLISQSFAKSRMPSITAAVLDKRVTAEELGQTNKSSKPGKSPGPEGLNLQYYKSFHDILAPYWLLDFN